MTEIRNTKVRDLVPISVCRDSIQHPSAVGTHALAEQLSDRDTRLMHRAPQEPHVQNQLSVSQVPQLKTCL
jgi:hypothetical protein